jgi:hypothetical protein
MLVRATSRISIMVIGLIGGWSSALYSIDAIGSSSVSDASSWRKWDLAPGTSSNPYALAHFLLDGKIPPAQSLFRIYSNGRDGEGSRLSSSCVYSVSMADVGSRWWSLSVTPSEAPEADSSSVLSSDDVVRASDGSLILAISAHPVPGNWIRPATSGSFDIQLLISNDGSSDATGDPVMPTVQRVGC